MEEKIETVLERFDFDRVHEVMEKINWTWGREGVPSSYQLIKSARRKLNRLADEDISKISSGGLTAYKDSNGELNLYFYISESDSYPF